MGEWTQLWGLCCSYLGASHLTLVINNLPADAGDIRDTGSIPGLGTSPEGSSGNHSSVLAWRISWTEAGYSP